jgi:hypothetical protein
MPVKKNPATEQAKDQRITMRTLHIRIRDKHAKFLRTLAYDVNQVWNFCVRREVAFSIVPAIGTCFPIGSTLDRQADLVTDRSEALLTTYPCAISASANPRGSGAALVASIR